MYRIIIAGSRNFNDYELVRQYLGRYLLNLDKQDVEIISGTARGADKLGELFAERNGLKCVRFPAQWDLYGKSAGYRRNAEMASYASDAYGVLFAFWDGVSKGTNHMISLGNKVGLEVHVIKYSDINKNKV